MDAHTFWEFSRLSTDNDYDFDEYVTSDEEDVAYDPKLDKEENIETLKREKFELKKQVRKLQIRVMQLTRDLHQQQQVEEDETQIVEEVETPPKISEEEQEGQVKSEYELVPGYVSTFYKCLVTGNITTTTPPLLFNKQYLDLPDEPLTEPAVPTYWTYIWNNDRGQLHSGFSCNRLVWKTLKTRNTVIKNMLAKKLRVQNKQSNAVVADPDDDDDGDDNDDGGYCSSTYLDLIVYENNIDFESASNNIPCDGYDTAEAVNRVTRWFSTTKSSMSNINFHLPKMMSTRFVKFLLAICSINSVDLSLPVNSPFISDHTALQKHEFWVNKFSKELSTCENILKDIECKILEDKDARRDRGLLEFRELVADKIEYLNVSRARVAEECGSVFTTNELNSFEKGVLGLARKLVVEPALTIWMESKQNAEPSSQRRYGTKRGYKRGTLINCPHCCHFSHTNQKQVNQHMATVHRIFAFNCSVCNYDSPQERHVRDHMKKIHKILL